jgi:uncharacterized protein
MGHLRNPLLLNVGFLLHQQAGYSYDFRLDYESIRVGEDLELKQFLGTFAVGRTARGLLFSGQFTAKTELQCARCLNEFSQPLSWTMTELYALTNKESADSGLVVPEDAQIDLRPLVREYALLEVPINPVCRLDCKGLCPECGQDRNLVDCGHRPRGASSSFEALADLLRD